ncbi:MAG: hypothetical protein K1Y01_01260 [Vicinamibacteria bacterium]|nr:hypothetical protein [Vicinamibacteria bacterium]
MVALIGLLLPWVRVAAVSAHLSLAHHRPEAGRHAVDLEDAFHGHYHTRGETHHQHSLTGCDFGLDRARTIMAVRAVASGSIVGLPAIPPAARTSARSSWERTSDHGPPGGPRRAVLRI